MLDRLIMVEVGSSTLDKYNLFINSFPLFRSNLSLNFGGYQIFNDQQKKLNTKEIFL